MDSVRFLIDFSFFLPWDIDRQVFIRILKDALKKWFHLRASAFLFELIGYTDWRSRSLVSHFIRLTLALDELLGTFVLLPDRRQLLWSGHQ